MDVDNNGHSDLYISKCRQGVSNPNSPLRINLLFMNDGNGNWTSEGEARGLAMVHSHGLQISETTTMTVIWIVL